MTAAQAQDRTELQSLAKQFATLDGQFGELDKRLATKADVEKAISEVRSDIQSVQIEQASVKTSLRWITWLLLLCGHCPRRGWVGAVAEYGWRVGFKTNRWSRAAVPTCPDS